MIQNSRRFRVAVVVVPEVVLGAALGVVLGVGFKLGKGSV